MGKRRIILLIACLVAIGGGPVGAHENAAALPHLSVRGEAELQVPADQLRLTVGVVTDGTIVADALQKNSARMREVVAALRQAGLTEPEYETGRLRVEPQWSAPPRQPSADWRPQIVGYTALNTLRIRTAKIAAAGEFIAAAAAAGANDIGEIVFDLADPRRYRAEAIRTATANALADARALAEAAAVRLGPVQSLVLDQAGAFPVPMAAERMMKMDAAAVPVTPGEVTVRAGVTVIYRVETPAADKRP